MLTRAPFFLPFFPLCTAARAPAATLSCASSAALIAAATMRDVLHAWQLSAPGALRSVQTAHVQLERPAAAAVAARTASGGTHSSDGRAEVFPWDAARMARAVSVVMFC